MIEALGRLSQESKVMKILRQVNRNKTFSVKSHQKRNEEVTQELSARSAAKRCQLAALQNDVRKQYCKTMSESSAATCYV
uniref:Uncharacterized protein n=1 Tax=Timema bartmani TaxID=61472 RepID=A0A7R9F2G6_9NEOP|nr:unnamed protein product [Timema bartmani]